MSGSPPVRSTTDRIVLALSLYSTSVITLCASARIGDEHNLTVGLHFARFNELLHQDRGVTGIFLYVIGPTILLFAAAISRKHGMTDLGRSILFLISLSVILATWPMAGFPVLALSDWGLSAKINPGAGYFVVTSFYPIILACAVLALLIERLMTHRRPTSS